MSADAARRAEYERFHRIDAAFRASDLAALRAAGARARARTREV